MPAEISSGQASRLAPAWLRERPNAAVRASGIGASCPRSGRQSMAPSRAGEETDPRDALADEVERAGGGFGEIEDAALGVGSAVVDADADRSAVGEVLHLQAGAEREGAVRGGESIGVELLAVGGGT